MGKSSNFENGGHKDTVEEESKLGGNERERTEGGDDEIDDHDEEKVEEEEEPEQLEDLIDEEDENKEENVGLNNQDHSGIELKSEKARDELYKRDDAASGGIDDKQIITDENK
ncbi:hypothetical protein LguiA_004533 [Lonicera macranthoides]